MIPHNFITEWETITAPWRTLVMIEQDLAISRALVDLYNNPIIRDSLVFRGGTALNKIYINPPARYSEDIDFVQIKSGPIGPIIDSIRSSLSNWLGEPDRKITNRSAKLIYKYIDISGNKSKLKIEINTTEHINFLDLKSVPYSVNSSWYVGNTDILTYQLEELLATKLRALYQRRKGRDLFDLWLALDRNLIDVKAMLEIFLKYCQHNEEPISKVNFIKNLEDKKNHTDFKIDMHNLLKPNIKWDFDKALDMVTLRIVNHLP